MPRTFFVAAALLIAAGCQPDGEPAPIPAAVETSNTSAPAAETADDVIVYVTAWCPYCRQAREYLDAEGVPYTAVDIEASEEAYAAYREAGGTGGIPLLVIGETTIDGWSQPAAEQALERVGL